MSNPFIATALIVVGIAWGALAFGAVYPWAYWPLTVLSVLIGALGLTAPSSGQRRVQNTALAVALLVFLSAIALQLVDISLSTVERLSPMTVDLARRYDTRFAAGDLSTLPLSIAPARTAVALTIFGSLVLLLVGMTRVFAIHGAMSAARATIIIGVIVAAVGIIQHPLFTGEIYGFWRPLEHGDSYGPFINKNHFAGWMLMALPLTFGLAYSRMTRHAREGRASFRDRVLSLSSPEASQLLLLFGSAAIMALSLIQSMSRSGMVAALLSVLLITALLLWKRSVRSRRLAGALTIMAVMALAAAWTGVDAIADRFSRMEVNSRTGAWADALAIAQRFPLAGTGMNTYGVATLFYQRHDLERYYAQAHNDYLQLAAEGGVLVGIPALICIALFVRTVRQRFREETSVSNYWLRAGATTGIVAIAMQETADFSLQMPGNAFLFVVLCAIALHRTPERRRSLQPPGLRA